MSSRWTWPASRSSSASAASPPSVRPTTTSSKARGGREQQQPSSSACSGGAPQHAKEQKALELMHEMRAEHSRLQRAHSHVDSGIRSTSPKQRSPPPQQAQAQASGRGSASHGTPSTHAAASVRESSVPPLEMASPELESDRPRWGLRSRYTYAQWRALKQKEADERKAHEDAAARALAKQRQAAKRARLDQEAADRRSKQAEAEAAASANLEPKAHGQQEAEGAAVGAAVGDAVVMEAAVSAHAGARPPATTTTTTTATTTQKAATEDARGGKHLPQSEQTPVKLDGSPPPKQVQSTERLPPPRASARNTLGHAARHSSRGDGGLANVYSSRSYAAAAAAARKNGRGEGEEGTRRSYMESYRNLQQQEQQQESAPTQRSARSSFMDATQRSADRTGSLKSERSSESPTGRFHPDRNERIMRRQLDPHSNINYYATNRQGGRYGAPDNDQKLGTGALLASQAFFESLRHGLNPDTPSPRGAGWSTFRGQTSTRGMWQGTTSPGRTSRSSRDKVEHIEDDVRTRLGIEPARADWTEKQLHAQWAEVNAPVERHMERHLEKMAALAHTEHLLDRAELEQLHERIDESVRDRQSYREQVASIHLHSWAQPLVDRGINGGARGAAHAKKHRRRVEGIWSARRERGRQLQEEPQYSYSGRLLPASQRRAPSVAHGVRFGDFDEEEGEGVGGGEEEEGDGGESERSDTSSLRGIRRGERAAWRTFLNGGRGYEEEGDEGGEGRVELLREEKHLTQLQDEQSLYTGIQHARRVRGTIKEEEEEEEEEEADEAAPGEEHANMASAPLGAGDDASRSDGGFAGLPMKVPKPLGDLADVFSRSARWLQAEAEVVIAASSREPSELSFRSDHPMSFRTAVMAATEHAAAKDALPWRRQAVWETTPASAKVVSKVPLHVEEEAAPSPDEPMDETREADPWAEDFPDALRAPSLAESTAESKDVLVKVEDKDLAV